MECELFEESSQDGRRKTFRRSTGHNGDIDRAQRDYKRPIKESEQL